HEGYGLVREKDLVLDIAKRLKRILEEAGATVILTRPDDKYYSLFYRSALVNTYILQTELAAVEKAKAEALQAKQDKEEELARKEREKVQKEADIDRYEAELIYIQNELSQNEARLRELQYALIQAENDLSYRQNDY